MGRVKIRYRWLGSDFQTNWARMAMPYAGNGRGIQFFPELGDEVLVVFERGDPERPLVIGALWNGRDKAPDNQAGNAAKRIVTRSGNTIQLLEQNDQGEAISIFTPKGECLISLQHGSGESIVTIHSDGDIQLQAKGEIRLKSKSFVQEVDGDSKRKVSGDESADVSGSATIKAGMDAALSGLNVVLKGGMNVESVAGAVNNIVGTMVHIQPPGFVGKQVSAKSAQVEEASPDKSELPTLAAPQRTADPKTPRGS
jgi:uncharacterized protein involved in type VI secretion and phage assembly